MLMIQLRALDTPARDIGVRIPSAGFRRRNARVLLRLKSQGSAKIKPVKSQVLMIVGLNVEVVGTVIEAENWRGSPVGSAFAKSLWENRNTALLTLESSLPSEPSHCQILTLLVIVAVTASPTAWVMASMSPGVGAGFFIPSVSMSLSS